MFKNEALYKLQNLKTTDPSQAISYQIGGKYYIAILDSPFYRTYLWNGAEFLLLKSSKCRSVNKIDLYFNNEQPVLLTTKGSKLTVYKPTTTGAVFQNITIDLQENYTDIFMILPIHQNDSYILLILKRNSTIATLLPFSIHFNRSVTDQQAEEEENDLLYCLRNLGAILEGHKRKDEIITKNVEKLTNQQLENTVGAAHTKDAVGSVQFGSSDANLENLQNYLVALRKHADTVQKKIQTFTDKVSSVYNVCNLSCKYF